MEISTNLSKKKARIIAYYLPQFHPIPENDEWWGKGFTEWTNVGKAKPLFKGHYQPRVPADLGYYDLRIPEIREAQAEMARSAGIEGFAYWHYWWAGKRLLEMPLNELLKTGKPNFPFCLSWANETWSGIWLGNPADVLMKQTYPGKNDFENHFYAVLDAFRDHRYIKMDAKPIFIVYRPLDIPNIKIFFDVWNELSIKNGLKGIFFIGIATQFSQVPEILKLGFDGVNTNGTFEARNCIDGKLKHKVKMLLAEKIGGILLNKYKYRDIIRYFFSDYDKETNVYPTLLPQWDNSPRSGRRSIIYHKSTPALFKEHLESAIHLIKHKDFKNRILFLKSWNEWAEGNYVEPDLKYGSGYLDVIKDIIKDVS